MNSCPIDIIVPTYNSAKYLDACLLGIKQSFDIGNIIVVDHYSTDDTIKIAKRHNANMYFEDKGLASALNLGIDKVKTEIFAIIDSDVVLTHGKWIDSLFRKFNSSEIGGIGLRVWSDIPLWRKKYAAFYQHTRDFKEIKGGTWVNAYVILKKALGHHFHIPESIGYTHLYIKDIITKSGYKIDFVDAEGIHYYDYHENKGVYMGAGERRYFGLRTFPVVIFRHVLLSPLKAIPPAIAYNDPKVIFGNTKYWFDFCRGYLNPKPEFVNIKRIVKS